MPIPAFDEHGLLPVGVHDCTLDEIKASFGSFQGSQGSDRRPQLFAKLESFVAEARAARLVRSIIVDGSFVTTKPDAYSDESGHLFRFISDTIPGKADSCRSEATLCGQ